MANSSESSDDLSDVASSFAAKQSSSDHFEGDFNCLRFRDEIPLERPTHLDSLLQSIFDVGGGGEEASGNTETLHTAELEAVLNKLHDIEEQFDEGLFLALRRCLYHHGLIQVCRDPTDRDLNVLAATRRDGNDFDREMAKRNIELEPIVFNFGLPDKEVDGPIYALGVARRRSGQQRSEESFLVDNSSSRSDSSSSGMQANYRLDHCSCLLERATRDGKWIVARIFSVVELKIGTDSECAVIEVDSDNKVRDVDLHAISQGLMYTFGWALPNHAESGELEDLSWAAIIGKKNTKAESTETAIGEAGEEGISIKNDEATSKKAKTMPPNKYRWMLGKIYVPEKCGELFEYSVTSCGILEDNDRGASCQSAISAYVEALVFGLRAAKRLQQAIKANERIVCPSSGKTLKFGQVELKLELRGKPKVCDALVVDIPQEIHWVISQGEIFTGKVNCSQLSQQPRRMHLESLLIFKDDDEEVDVAVKVSSLSVHRYLNHPTLAWSALEKINSALVLNKLNEAKKSNEQTSGVSKKWDLFNVLYAAESMPNSLITIMADLSIDYKVLTPKKDKMSFDELWTAFRDLVARILFPLAELWVIHPDIRPGWNFTSNILYKMNHSSEKPAMQIIDFESLVPFIHWIPPNRPRFKYIQPENSWSCYTFLFWQCVTLGYAWKRKKSQKEMEKTNVQDEFLTDEKGNSISYADACEWKADYQMKANEFDAFLERLGDILSK